MGDVSEAESQHSAACVERPQAITRPSAIFQIGDGHLVLDASDDALNDRFRRLYGDCEVEAGAASGPRVHCAVESDPESAEVIVDFDDPAPVDLSQFLETAFADRGCRRLPASDGEWQSMMSDNPRTELRVRGQRVRFAADSHWQALAANLAVGLVLRLQSHIIFLHASAVAVGVHRRGVLFIGSKGAGKTTTSIGLASRGHAFLGDEIVGVRQATREIVAVPRTISKRDGPCADAVERTLSTMSPERAPYPDGPRTILPASRLFGRLPSDAPLSAIVFLDGFGPTPSLVPVTASIQGAAKLTPVTSTLWGSSPPARAFALVRLLSAAPVYSLQLGPPDETAQLLEDTFSD